MEKKSGRYDKNIQKNTNKRRRVTFTECNYLTSGREEYSSRTDLATRGLWYVIIIYWAKDKIWSIQ